MKKIVLVCILIVIVGCAGGNRNLPPGGEKITSITDTSKCTFLKNVYFEAQARTMVHYAQLNTHNAGGNAYKIVSNTQERVAGVNIHMINIEVYKCKE